MFFNVAGETVDSVELKCLVISRGLKIDREVYQKCGKDYRIYPNALKGELLLNITPGKRSFTTKQRHLDALTYIADKYGPGKSFCNFIIGLEPFETLKEGATVLAERGVIPSASVWMPFGKPVNGSMKPASLEYFRKTKDMLAELYVKYDLEPAGCCGLNVCVERDIWRAVTGAPCC